MKQLPTFLFFSETVTAYSSSILCSCLKFREGNSEEPGVKRLPIRESPLPYMNSPEQTWPGKQARTGQASEGQLQGAAIYGGRQPTPTQHAALLCPRCTPDSFSTSAPRGAGALL